MAATLLNRLLSLVVPPLCVACRDPVLSGGALCGECRFRLVPLPHPRCLRCGAPASAEPTACRECRGRSLGFDHAWSAFAYEGVARRVVAALKVHGAVAVARTMGAELASRAPPEFLQGSLVPVPAHHRRRRRHGFNQAKAISVRLGAESGLPLADVLERSRQAAPQVGRPRNARLVNAGGSVAVRRGAAVPEQAVLVDDVYTTGATLDACARALKAAGSLDVVALTFARAMRG